MEKCRTFKMVLTFTNTLRITGPCYRRVWMCQAKPWDLQTTSFEIPWFLGINLSVNPWASQSLRWMSRCVGITLKGLNSWIYWCFPTCLTVMLIDIRTWTSQIPWLLVIIPQQRECVWSSLGPEMYQKYGRYGGGGASERQMPRWLVEGSLYLWQSRVAPQC